MPKPPTAERGRQARAAVAPAPARRPSLRERVAERRAAAWSVDTAGDPDAPGRHWRAYVTPLLCLLALGMSIYLTITHFAPGSLVCPLGSATHGAINCAKVTTSPQSYVFGIPVAILGLVFYLPMTALCLPRAWRSTHRLVAPARLAAAVVGVGMVCYLVYAELYEIHAICILCTTVHVLTFLLFVCIVTGWEQARAPYEETLAPAE